MQSPTLHVSTSGSDDTGDGSEEYPFATIQAGIIAASDDDTVLVAAGTYTENINYNGKNIVVGSLYLTTSDTSYISSTIIDGDQNGSVVTFENGEGSSAKLIGFTIQNGSGGGNDQNDGGGIYCNGSSPTLTHLTITGNSVTDKGGGIWTNYSNLTLTNSTIRNNSASESGGGVYFRYSASPSLNTVNISNNSANTGAGFYCEGSSPSLVNVMISNNSASWGGGIYLNYVSNPSLENVTISGNSASFGGGILCSNDSNPSLMNCILWNDSPQEFYFYQSMGQGPPSVNITYTDIQGGEAGIITSSTGTVTWGSGNIDFDPLFVDAANGDYSLSNYSPAIGAGTATGASTTDIDGNSRPNPSGSSPDMGAYENALGTPSAPPAPTNLAATVGNSVVNLSWTGNDYATSYSVYRSTTSGSGFTAIATGLSTTSYQNTGLTNETTYYYKVSATGAGGESDLTAEISAKPKAQKYTVKTDGTGDYIVIQTAIDATTNGDTVLVYAGTYTENINYNGKNIVVGSLFLTTGDTSYISSTIIDANSSGRGVLFSSGSSSAAVLDGFTIKNGSTINGGGIYIKSSSAPTLRNLVVTNNSSTGTEDNYGMGGGIYAESYSGFSLSNSVVSNNTADFSAGIAVNNGIYGTQVTITDVTITGNTAIRETGGISINSDAVLTNCTISNNSTIMWGPGGIKVNGSSPVFYNCLIKNNYADQYGGAVVAANLPGPTFINCTFVKNRTENREADIYLNYTEMIFINSILWDPGTEQIGFNGTGENTLTFANSVLKGGIESIESLFNYEWNDVSWDGIGNIDSYPLFADTTNGDYALTNYSPAIGAGTASVTIGGTTFTASSTDIDGNARPNPADTDPDIGAFENALGSPSAPPAPTNLAATVGNSVVNLSWTGNDYGTSYSVYRSTTSGSGFTAIATGISTTSYQNTGLTNETTYYYKVSSTGHGGESDLTAEISAKPKAQKYTVKTDDTGDYTVIQTAIDATTDGDTVLVYAGTYTENINYNGKNIVVGSLYLTTQDTSYISSTIIDGNQAGSVVTFENGETTDATLIGVSVINGYSSRGAGIYATNTSGPTLKNIIVSNCNAVGDLDGGGAYVQGDAIIKNSTFKNNSGRKGGALLLSGSSQVENCLILNNAGSESGSGLQLNGGSPTIKNTVIAGGSGGPVIWCQGSDVDMVNVTITDNTVDNSYDYIIYLEGSGSVSVTNSILYNSGSEEAGNMFGSFPVSVSFTYSNVEGGPMAGE